MGAKRDRYASVAYGGMDVHYKFSNVTLRDAAGRVVVREKLDHRDRSALRRQVRRWPAGTPLALEASFGWGWLSDELRAAGLEPRLSNCYKVEQMRKARGQVKTNEKDAELLSLLPAETGQWWRVWLAPPEVRDRREWLRYRMSLVALQTQTKNRIHAHFHRHGIYHEFSDLFGSQGRQFLMSLCATGRHSGGVLPPGALASLSGQVRLLLGVRAELARVTVSLREQLERDALTQRLKTIPGFGVVLSHVVAAEVGQIERFAGHKPLASYAGLAPRARDTGEAKPSQAPLGRHLGPHCQRTLKWAFIEAAHGAVRTGGRWRALFDRVTSGGTKDRQRGYIKVARELVKVLYVVWSRRTTYQDAPPARPGSRRARGRGASQDSRSGTGQSCHPMVPVPACRDREASV
jgi:transposase